MTTVPSRRRMDDMGIKYPVLSNQIIMLGPQFSRIFIQRFYKFQVSKDRY